MKAYIKQDIEIEQEIKDGNHNDTFTLAMRGEPNVLYEITSFSNNWFKIRLFTNNYGHRTYNFHRSWLIFENEVSALTIPDPLVMAMF